MTGDAIAAAALGGRICTRGEREGMTGACGTGDGREPRTGGLDEYPASVVGLLGALRTMGDVRRGANVTCAREVNC